MEALLAQRSVAAGHGTGRGTAAEETVHAGRAHRVVAFGIDEEGERGVEIAVGLADGADVVERRGVQNVAL